MKPRNGTLDRYQFLSRKQQQIETLKQFWNVLTGLAPRCNFGEQSNSLIILLRLRGGLATTVTGDRAWVMDSNG